MKYYSKNIISLFSLTLLFSCMGEGKEKTFPNESFLLGQRLYITHCQSCHQEDGKGFKSLYPPLANSDFFDQNKNLLPCIIKNGLVGEIAVNGKIYNQTMPANPSLNTEEIRDIIVYITNSWGKTEGNTSLQKVKSQLNTCP